ncbi:MAG: tRNA lysidine(34) synthetase TilS [Burkholderiales bacterium]|nr:tRNA lysidine(34) synthetase TilS [Burkholderiales bacterium]
MSSARSCDAHEIEAVFRASLESCIQTLTATSPLGRLAIAYSGGLDSSVLLSLAQRYCVQAQIPLFAYYINHGLSEHASDWQAHCARQCTLFNVPFKSRSVQVQNQGQGIESEARQQRYRALGALCQEDQVQILLTAHHSDDQAETMLMQLFRGTGLRGLAGMDQMNVAPDLLLAPSLAIARPLLTCSKAQLHDYAHAHQLECVHDESNTDTHFTRNALRLNVMPEIARIFPEFSERLQRTAAHMRSSIRLLDELAAQDLRDCSDQEGVLVQAVLELNQDRRQNLFRYWLLSHRVKLPSVSKLDEMCQQLLHARDDARIQIRHEHFLLSRYDGRLALIELRKCSEHHGEIHLRWQGEESLPLPQLKGRLLFVRGSQGIAEDTLLEANLVVRQRVPGARLRLAANRPSRDLKSHFQSARIPFWQREKLPYIYVDERLFFVGLLGIDAAFINTSPDTPTIELRWVPD